MELTSIEKLKFREENIFDHDDHDDHGHGEKKDHDDHGHGEIKTMMTTATAKRKITNQTW